MCKQQVDEYLDRASEILANWSSGDTPTALRLLNEALLSSPHSERALELKARALLILRRYEEVVQLCEQSLVAAERNHPQSSGDSSIYQLLQAAGGGDSTKSGATSPLKMWRWQLTAKARFHLGRLEEALETLQKRDEMASIVGADKASSAGTSPGSEPWALSVGIIRDLLRHKAAGNDAFQNGKHAEAVEHYSAALACNGESRPFNAVCFCNRAAASQALGHIADAIADCSRAIALDPKYAKAISRRATLHESARDYGQSCHDLQRLITLLEGQQQQSRTTLSPSRVGRSTTHTQQDLRQTRERLAKAEDEMKKGHPLDHYMILGLEPGCSSNEIKKAYRKAALRHHPDKVIRFKFVLGVLTCLSYWRATRSDIP
jgi:DnaJ family protein C protein 7